MTHTAEKHELQRLIDDLYVDYRHLTEGQVATYIPELAKASPDDFGICIVTEDGRTFEVGDCDRPFTMQSVTKPFTFGMALEELGHDEVWRYVGVEPRQATGIEPSRTCFSTSVSSMMRPKPRSTSISDNAPSWSPAETLP